MPPPRCRCRAAPAQRARDSPPTPQKKPPVKPLAAPRAQGEGRRVWILHGPHKQVPHAVAVQRRAVKRGRRGKQALGPVSQLEQKRGRQHRGGEEGGGVALRRRGDSEGVHGQDRGGGEDEPRRAAGASLCAATARVRRDAVHRLRGRWRACTSPPSLLPFGAYRRISAHLGCSRRISALVESQRTQRISAHLGAHLAVMKSSGS